jgi:serine/threonine-protein kinase RIO1
MSNSAKPICFIQLEFERSADQIFIRLNESPLGQLRAPFVPPFSPGARAAKLEAIENREVNKAELAEIGQQLFQALEQTRVGEALRAAINEARRNYGQAILQLRFNENAVDLASLPWELLHDGRRYLLAAGAVDLTRYIAYPEAVVPLEVTPPLRVLQLVASPADLPPLDVGKTRAALDGVPNLIVERLSQPTFDALQERLSKKPRVHVLHFDGHGGQLGDEQVVLFFEDEHGDSDPVDAETLHVALYHQVDLVVLNACLSSKMTGRSVFNSLAPALIEAGIPAVVGMQFSIPDDAAARFIEAFYSAVAEFEPLTRAITAARRRLYREGSWYIPTLYLRSGDQVGQLFSKVISKDKAGRTAPVNSDGPRTSLEEDVTPTDLIQVQLLDEEYPLAKARQKTLVEAIAHICDLPPGKAQLLAVKPEGLWVGIAIPKSSAERLVKLFETNDQDLGPLRAEFRIGDISVLPVHWPQTGFETFRPEYTLLVQLLYLGEGEVLIERELGGGFGGARVFLAQPINRQGRAIARQIIKISEGPELRSEYDNTVQLVGKDLPLIAARLDNYAEFGELAGITYTFVGDGMLGQTQTFEAYYQNPQVSMEEIIRTLKDLMDAALGQQWYSQSKPHNCRFDEEYGSHLAEYLRLKLRPASADGIWQAAQAPAIMEEYKQLATGAIVSAHQDISPAMLVQIEDLSVSKVRHHELKLQHPSNSGIVVKVEGQLPPTISPGDKIVVRGEVIYNRQERLREIISAAFSGFAEAPVDLGQDRLTWGPYPDGYPNPLHLYPEVLDWILRGKKSIVHGDLHLRNILVDRAGRGWLIDFARVTERHNLYDFIKLETYIRQMVLSQEKYKFSFAAYLQFENALLAASLGGVDISPKHPDLQKAYQVIQSLRQIAAHYVGHHSDFKSEYFPALFLYNLAVLKYYEHNGDKAARLAFAAAAVVGRSLGKTPRLQPEKIEWLLSVADAGANPTEEQLLEQITLQREKNDQRGLATSLADLANLTKDIDRERTQLCYERSIEILESIGDRNTATRRLRTLGDFHAGLNRPEEAMHSYRRSLQLARLIADRQEEALTLAMIGRWWWAARHSRKGTECRQKAVAYWEQSLPMLRDLGSAEVDRVERWLRRAKEEPGSA